MDDLIELLNRGGTYAYYWLKEPDGSSKTIWYPVGQMPDIPPDATNVYFGVNPCKAIPQAKRQDGKPIPPEYQRATLENLAAINCLFAEFDAKDYGGDKDRILQHLDNLSIQPNVIVDSGGGYHCYWLLYSPMQIIDHATLEYFRGIQYRWVQHVGGDVGAKDLCRVLRVPGTYNYKYDPPEEVIIISQDMHYYELPDLIAILPPEPEQQPQDAPPLRSDLPPNAKNWLDKALAKRTPGMSNEVGFWLAAQLRDDGISQGEAESIMLNYASGVRMAGSKSGYSDKEALDTLRSAYRSTPRKPARNMNKPVTIPGTRPAAKSQPEKRNGNGHHLAGGNIENYLPDESQWPDGPEVTDLVPPSPAESQGPTPSEQAIVTAPPPDEAVQDPNAENGDAGHGKRAPRYLPFATVKAALDAQEYGDAELMAEFYRGKMVYDHAEGAWYLWRGHYWERDKVGIVYRAIARKIAPQYLHAAAEAAEAGQDDTSKKMAARAAALRNKKRMDNVLSLASRQDGIALTGDEWDADPWVLGCGNGVIDLRSGKIRPGRPEDYIRAHSPVMWDQYATCPTWQRFMSEVFGGDADLVAFMRRLLGYSITGLTREHVFPVLWGEGRNGKSTMLETLADVLGNDIATSSQADALMDASRGGDGPKPFIWSLRGKRLVWASESNEGRRINEGLVKQLTGGDRLNVRTLHSKPVEFLPTHTLLLLTNHKPHINADGSAIWDRVYLIPYTQRFIDQPQAENEHKRDPDLREKLQAELPGILAWLVRGCLEYQTLGLIAPAAIVAATSEYRDEEDTTGMYVQERCILKDGAEVKSSLLYQDYSSWCKENGIQPMSITAFGKWIKKRVKSRRDGDGVYLEGIGLLALIQKKIPF